MTRDDGSLCELGRGAMGITYKGLDTRLRVPVALKVINAAHLHSEKARQRFVREARSAAKLRHRNVASVFHLGQEDDNYFYAMEFIDGETVDTRLKRQGPFAVEQALLIAGQVARALNAAQTHELVHRDIKPANLMLVNEDDELVVKVIDFGLAKVSLGGDEEAAPLTISGFLGTPHFASPEQLEEREIDVRSDIYSLGVTLWFMLTGKPPFSGSVVQVMSQHISRPPPFEDLAGIPEPAVKLLRRMLEKNPADRPQTAADLRREIERCQKQISQSAIPETGTQDRPPPVEISETAPTEAEETQFATGAALGERFLITEHLGENESGLVFRAHDNRENCDVRLLVLDRELLRDAEMLAQLERDSEKLAAINNPHVLGVVGLETSGLDCYLTLEWIDGFSLRDLLRARRELALSEVLKILPQAAEGLDVALAANLEHLEVGLPQMLVHFPDDGVAPETFLRRPLAEWPEFAVKLNALTISHDRLALTWAGDRTMVGSPRSNGRENGNGRAIREFGALIYELLGGVPTAVNPQRYTPLASVDEAGNSVLQKVILTPESFASAAEFARLFAAPPQISRAPPVRTAAETATPEAPQTEAPRVELRAEPAPAAVVEEIAPPVEPSAPPLAPVEEKPSAESAPPSVPDAVNDIALPIESSAAPAVFEEEPIVEPEPPPQPPAEEPQQPIESAVASPPIVEPAPTPEPTAPQEPKLESMAPQKIFPPPQLAVEEAPIAAPAPPPSRIPPPPAIPPTRRPQRRFALLSGSAVVLLLIVAVIYHFGTRPVPLPTPTPVPVVPPKPVVVVPPTPVPTTPTPLPPPPTRQELANKARKEAEALEARQANREALQAWLKFAREYDEFGGKASLQLLIERLRTRPSGWTQAEFEALRSEITQAAQLDVLAAMLLLGEQLRKTEPATAFAWFCTAAEKENAKAMTEAGLMIFSADGVPRDDAAAIDYLKRAADLGQPRAVAALGECHLYGRGVGRDAKRGIELLKQAADLGETPAMTTLGDAFHKGLATANGKPDDKEAFRWFSEAANRGNVEALRNLGVLYMMGAGVKKDPKIALEKFKDGMAKGDAGSMYFYGLSLKDGLGVPKNLKEAKQSFEKAAEKYKVAAQRGNIESMYFCASSLELIDEIDNSKAHFDEMKEYYRKAAEAGSVKAGEWCKIHGVEFLPPTVL
ncbi:MAG TPA: protein kinase [Chthoniobacteraceae bacterium]|nr:protein kinase [Chthoniobacteraceae bacterium]